MPHRSANPSLFCSSILRKKLCCNGFLNEERPADEKTTMKKVSRNVSVSLYFNLLQSLWFGRGFSSHSGSNLRSFQRDERGEINYFLRYVSQIYTKSLLLPETF